MYRLLTAPLMLAFTLALAPAAPVPREARGLYFPTAVGARWVYQKDDKEVIDEVTGVEWTNGTAVVTVCRGGHGEDRDVLWRVAVSEAGLSWVERLKDRLDPPRCFLRLPARAGETWEWTGNGHPPHAQTWQVDAHGLERVKVPAGEYTAARVDHRRLGVMCMNVYETLWYAPKVGPVKSAFNGRSAWVLKSFTPGRE